MHNGFGSAVIFGSTSCGVGPGCEDVSRNAIDDWLSVTVDLAIDDEVLEPEDKKIVRTRPCAY
jgi:hypothetical protein